MTTPNERERIKREADELWEVFLQLSSTLENKKEAKQAANRVEHLIEFFKEKGWFGAAKSQRVALAYVHAVYFIHGARHNIHYGGSGVSQKTLKNYQQELAHKINKDQGYEKSDYELDDPTQETPGHKVGMPGEDPIKELYNI